MVIYKYPFLVNSILALICGYYIVNSFIRINGKRMSNGPMESANGRLDRLLSDGYGYTNFERFRNRALFSLNKNEPINI